MEQKDYRLAAIMYTDIAGFSRMMERDEAGTLQLLTYHNELIGGIVESHHGKVIKTIGDALLIDFKNTVEALQSAMEVQDRLYERNKANPDSPLLVRIGLHLGDIYFFENDALGEGINIAARLQSFAKPGCICFSQDVYNIVLNKIEFNAQKLGKVSLKNITKEIHAYEIKTPNVEFDPDRDKPRPGYTPSSYKDEDAAPAAAAPATAKAAAETPPELLGRIRREILEETKELGRRMSVAEARGKYSQYGVEADEVIATMAEQGLLIRSPGEASSARSDEGAANPFRQGFGRDERGDFDSNILKNDIEAAVSGIVSGIERSVNEHMSEVENRDYGHGDRYAYKYEHYREKAERHAEKYARKAERHAERERGGRSVARSGDFSAYKGWAEKKAHEARGGLAGNLSSFLAVNGFLWFINLTTSAGFLWAAIPTFAWGIGVAATVVGSRRASARLRELDAMPELEGETLADYRKLDGMRDAMAQHASSTAMVCIFLGMLNLLTSPAFLWFLIPSAAMLVGFFAHAASYGPSKARLENKILGALGIKGGWRNLFKQGKAQKAEAAGLGPYADLYREAQAAKEAIASQLASGSMSQVNAELAPSLDHYLGQVRLLAQSANEIDRLVESIPMTDLSKDKAELVAKEAAAASPSLKAEYRSSIEEIDKQERSYAELREQSEVVKLRLGSSVNQLKQMRLDIARLAASPNAEGGADLESLKRRTDELSRYLEDLRSGYSESKDDPFAQLEAEEKKRLESNKAAALPEDSVK
jgi:Adenylate cyclase, family 3 (some proteins contain HAMP domain)